METQEVVFALANELGIQYETVPFENDQIIARGTSAQDSDTLRSLAYPLVDASENAFYDKLRFGQERANAAKYPDFRSYLHLHAEERAARQCTRNGGKLAQKS